MPTLFKVRNIRVAIYPNDHPPPHVHALRPDGALAKFNLNCPGGPVVLVEQQGFRPTDISQVGAAVAADLPAVCAKWRELHG